MARFCGVFSPRNPGLMRRQDVQAMLGAFFREGTPVESAYFDDASGFGIAAVGHQRPGGADFLEAGGAVAAYNGYISRGDSEVAGEEGARLLLDVLGRG